MSYGFQLATMCAINSLLGMAAYLPLSAGHLIVCLGAAMGIGAFTAGLLIQFGGDGAWLLLPAVLAGAFGGSLFMAVTAAIVSRMSGFILSIATVAIAITAQGSAQNIQAVGGALGFRLQSDGSPAWLVAVVAIAALLTVLAYERTLLRRVVALSADDSSAALSYGINPGLVKHATLVAAGALAGAAGSLYILNVGLLDPTVLGFESGLMIATYAIVGGRRSVFGSIACAVALTLLAELLSLTPASRMMAYGLLLVGSVALRAQWPKPSLGSRHHGSAPRAPLP